MTTGTTTHGREDMSCDAIAADAVAERYLLGQLSEPEQSAFEQHYFDCARCLGELQALEAMRTEWRGTSAPAKALTTSRASWLAWAGIAATVVLAAGIAYWTMRPRPDSGLTSASGAAGPVAPPPVAAAPVPQAPPVEVPPVSVAQLARFDPPPFTPVVLRGPEDEARRLFQGAMLHYVKGEHRQAVDGLRGSARLDPAAPDSGFFLGVCLLLTGQPAAGTAELQRTIALGDSPYLEEAHFYLAKGALQRGDVSAATRTLQSMIALRGDRQRDAKELLSLIERTSASTTLRDTYLINVAAKCTSMITGRYPFVPNGPGVRDVRLLDFGDLFGYGGTFHQFFTTHLEKFVDTTRRPWTWKPDAPSGLPLEVFEQAQRIREMFFEQSSRALRLEFNVSFSQLDGAERVLLEFDGNILPARGEGPWKMTWPGPKPRRAVVIFAERHKAMEPHKTARVSAEGDWAMFKLLGQGAVTWVDAQQFRVLIGKDNYRVTIVIDGRRFNNVFAGLSTLHGFRCGG